MAKAVRSAPIDDAPTPIETDWLREARAMLIEGGVGAVQINPLAQRLGVTRGGFYWRFANRKALLDRLLKDWELGNTASLLAALDGPGTAPERLARAADVWIEEAAFDPSLDAAIRAWGRIDAAVAIRVHAADDARIAALQRLCRDAGDDEMMALVRARIIYFHQVGYYAMGLHETREQRKALLPIYNAVLLGTDRLPPGLLGDPQPVAT